MFITTQAQYHQRKIRVQYDIHGNITTLTEAEGLEALRRYYDGVNNIASPHYQEPMCAIALRGLRDLLAKHGVSLSKMNKANDTEEFNAGE